MYKSYFGFRDAPFTIAPDPHFLYMSRNHREALAHLLYGVRGDGGFVLLTGDVGTGKTTVCRCLLEQLPGEVDVAFVLSPKLTALELLATICDEFRITYPERYSSKTLVDLLYAYLLAAHAAGRKALLIIDEAQNLSKSVLEQLRLLTNLETSKRKLLQVILLGQPELRQVLEQPDMAQLAQRITARYHLGPLSRQETAAYVRHRLAVAGVEHPLFPPATLTALFRRSRGIPRLINLLCDRALTGAYAKESLTVTPALLRRAAHEVFDRRPGWACWRRVVLVILAGVALLLGAMTMRGLERRGYLEAQPIPAVPSTRSPALAAELWADVPRGATSKRQALAVLSQRWQLPAALDGEADVCDQVAVHGLECLSRKGSLGSLRRYNRPALLRLVLPDGAESWCTLVTLTPSAATVAVGSEVRQLSSARLEEVWLGDYTLLWRPPFDYAGKRWDDLTPTDRTWVLSRLTLFDGGKGLEVSERIRIFQQERGLVPDGLIGPVTLMRLNELAGAGEPVLAGQDR